MAEMRVKKSKEKFTSQQPSANGRVSLTIRMMVRFLKILQTHRYQSQSVTCDARPRLDLRVDRNGEELL